MTNCKQEEFGALVNELSFTVKNLEKVSAQLSVFNSQKALLKHQLQDVRNPESVLLLEEAATSPIPDSTWHIRSLATEKAHQMNGEVGFDLDTQSNFGRCTEPTAKDEATQINGAVSADALRILFGK